MNRIANVENIVCSVEMMSRHQELYHYTKPTGVPGHRGLADAVVLALSRDARYRRTPADA
jgi:hypothetical protein